MKYAEHVYDVKHGGWVLIMLMCSVCCRIPFPCMTQALCILALLLQLVVVGDRNCNRLAHRTNLLFCQADFVVTMAKLHILLDPTQSPTSKQPKTPSRANWERCVLCQQETDKPFLCPLKSTKSPLSSSYASLAEDLCVFQGLQHLPLDLSLERLDDGDSVEATLHAHRAQQHKKC